MEKFEIVKCTEPKFLKVEGVKVEGRDFIFERLNKKRATIMLVFNWNYTKIFLVKQFRFGPLCELWETPAGILEDHLTPLENAYKEIEEETGYKREDIIDMEEMQGGYVSPGYTSEYSYFFSARIKKNAKAENLNLDEHEMIYETGFFTLEEAEKLGALEDMKTNYAISMFKAKKRKRIGVFGGTFDPPTFLHLRTAERAMEEFDLDEIIFEPVHNNYFTNDKTPLSSSVHRTSMIKLAIDESGNNNFKIGEFEVNETIPPSTFETLDYYKEVYGNADLFFICGSDILKSIPTWQRSQYLLENNMIITIQVNNDNVYHNIILENELLTKYRKNIKIIYEVAESNASSKSVRNSVRGGMSINCMVPNGVKAYIEENRLYNKNW